MSRRSWAGVSCGVCQEPLRMASLISSGMESNTRLISRTKSWFGVCLWYFSLYRFIPSSIACSQAGSRGMVTGGERRSRMVLSFFSIRSSAYSCGVKCSPRFLQIASKVVAFSLWCTVRFSFTVPIASLSSLASRVEKVGMVISF